jgi:nitroreductase
MHDPSKGALPFQAASVARSVEEALLSRRSIRAFRSDPVARETIERVLALASRAPSGTNVQPWKVYAAAGEVRDRIAAEMHAEFMQHGEENWQRQYEYYPTKWRDPYLARRRKLGWELYGLLGIAKGERDKTKVQHGRNYLFFDAPAALVFTIDDDFEKGSWLDYGMAVASAHTVLRRHLPIPDSQIVICGMSIGYSRDDVVNTLVTEREPVASFTTFAGF